MVEANEAIRFPILSPGITASVPKGEDLEPVLTTLTDEFTAKANTKFKDGLRLCLETSGDQVAADPTHFQKGAEVFRFENESGKTVAVSVAKYYSWDLIRSQLDFGLTRSPSGQIDSLCLQPFENVVGNLSEGSNKYSMAVELAYSVVDREYRGQGLGSQMFALRIARANYIHTDLPKVIFTMSRGAHLHEETGKKTFEYILKRERDVNGLNENGTTKISHLQIPITDIRQFLGLSPEYNFEQVYPDSQPVLKLAKKVGMVQNGLFRDLSPIIAMTNQSV